MSFITGNCPQADAVTLAKFLADCDGKENITYTA